MLTNFVICGSIVNVMREDNKKKEEKKVKIFVDKIWKLCYNT